MGVNEISKFTIDQQDAIEIRQMTDIYSSSIKSGATGAAAGTVVALAASGSLSVVTSGLATAGTVLMAGEVGAAAGIVGSALSFGAAMTPLAAVAAPVVLFTGISASMKANENLEKANTMYAEAEAASEKMRISETLCYAICEKSEMFDSLLIDLNKMFVECSSLLAGVVKKKEGRLFKKKLTSADFTEEDLKLVAVTRALAGAVKTVIDTPILSESGEISYEAENIYDKIVEKLPDFNQAVQEVKTINFNIKPIEAQTVKQSTNQNSVSTGTTVMSGARKVFAFVVGFILASTFARNIAFAVSDEYSKFLFLNAYTVNLIAVWLLLFINIVVIVGKFKGQKIEKWYAVGSGISLFILYVQYCRTVELMNHYIIFSIIVIFVSGWLFYYLDNRKTKWQFAQFVSSEALVIMFFSIMFLVYAFFSKFIGFSDGFCLTVTSIFAFIVSIIGMPGVICEKQH